MTVYIKGMFKKTIIFLLLILLVQYLHAQITHDASSTNAYFSCAGGSHSHTCTGSCLILIASFALMNSQSVTSASYNGTALTQKSAVDHSVEAELWYLINPDVGGAWTFAFTAAPNTAVTIAVNSWAGVNQAIPFGTVVTGTGSSVTSSSITVSSAANEMVVDMIATFVDCTVDASQTERASKSDFYSTHTSSEDGAGSVDMDWTFPLDDCAMIGVPLKPHIDGPLPIILLRFKTKLIDDQVHVSWTTLSETNNDYFTVERSLDGIDFETVEIIPGAGDSFRELNYETMDSSPYYGTSYYRLKQTDYDGGFEYSKLTAISNIRTSKSNLLKLGHISPNPVNGNDFSIKIINAPHDELEVIIHNLLGETIYSAVHDISNGLKQLEVGTDIELPDGSYLVVFEGGSQLVVKRLMVVRN